MPQDPPTDAWRELTYVYDASGRRIEKRYDGLTILKYIYDGDSCIAEYDAGGNLRRKYIYGPGVDEPVCMIEATVTPAATYYYHFDASGSVVALTNSSGNTVEVYDYSVYGQVGATDASHPNRFMFTGREFDKETGLYFYRARHYKPEIGRFLQVDPVGYKNELNLYRYCRNNPVRYTDSTGNDPEGAGVRPPSKFVTIRDQIPGCRYAVPSQALLNARLNISDNLLLCLFQKESSMRTDANNGDARGLGQMRPIACKDVDNNWFSKDDAGRCWKTQNDSNDACSQIANTEAYLAILVQRNKGDVREALRRYGSYKGYDDYVNPILNCEKCMDASAKTTGLADDDGASKCFKQMEDEVRAAKKNTSSGS